MIAWVLNAAALVFSSVIISLIFKPFVYLRICNVVLINELFAFRWCGKRLSNILLHLRIEYCLHSKPGFSGDCFLWGVVVVHVVNVLCDLWCCCCVDCLRKRAQEVNSTPIPIPLYPL